MPCVCVGLEILLRHLHYFSDERETRAHADHHSTSLFLSVSLSSPHMHSHTHTHTLTHLRSPWEKPHLKYLDPQASWIKSWFLFFTNMPTSLAVESILDWLYTQTCVRSCPDKQNTCTHRIHIKGRDHKRHTDWHTHIQTVAYTHFKTDF